jgi:hypothetical protein
MDGNKLVLSEDEFDSEQALTGDVYGKQAKVYNGKCQAPSGGGTRYYVRKFNYGGSNTDLLSSFKLTVPGISALNGSNLEVWLWAASNLNVGRRCDMATGNTDPYGFKGMGKSCTSGGEITVEVGPTIMQGEDFYIAVKIAAGKEITGDMILA